MSRLDFDPLAAVGEDIRSVFGRTAVFLTTCFAAAVFAALAVTDWGLFAVLLPPVTWGYFVYEGLEQGCGLLSYAVLAVLFGAYVHLGAPAVRILSWTFLLQSFEAMRCKVPPWPWSPRLIAVFLIWLILALLLALFTLARRYPGLAVGPLAFLALHRGRGGGGCGPIGRN
jgi:hypothetical protein